MNPDESQEMTRLLEQVALGLSGFGHYRNHQKQFYAYFFMRIAYTRKAWVTVARIGTGLGRRYTSRFLGYHQFTFGGFTRRYLVPTSYSMKSL